MCRGLCCRRNTWHGEGSTIQKPAEIPRPTEESNRPIKIFLASTNPGKLREYDALAQDSGAPVQLGLLPGIETMPEFEESAPTFGENALGKALNYSKASDQIVLADDSGLVVPALGGEPGVRSARYAGPNASSGERMAKLLRALASRDGEDRRAYFVCVIAVAWSGRALAIVSDRVDGEILEATRGERGFGYDPVFYLPEAKKSFAELSMEEKNRFSHRGRAFRGLLSVLPGML